jgi:hypothetical protein
MLMPLEKLKEFILFWSFLFADGVSHDFFERSSSNYRIDQDMPNAVAPSEARVDLANLRVFASLQQSPHRFDLCDLYRAYLSSAPELRQWVSLYMFNPSRGMVNQVFSLHDNYRITTSFAWTILEALSGYKAKRCESMIECPKGCRDPDDPSKPALARVAHPMLSVRQRVRELFAPFPECDYLVQVAMTIYRDDRNPFYHQGEGQSLPTREPPSGREDLIATRSNVTLYGKDPLETHDAIILLRDAVRCLLLNRLFPQLNFYPAFERLKSVSFRP